jgi:hypothetical protein
MNVSADGRTFRSARRWLRLGLPLLLLGLSGCSGCSGCGPQVNVVPLTPAEDALKYIAMAYLDAHSELNRPPKNAEDLRPFLKRFGDPEQLLVSPNDGQPFVIVWGADPNRGGPTEYMNMFPILAYEKQGAGGKRAVTDIRGRPMTVPAEDLSKLTFVRGHKPSAD